MNVAQYIAKELKDRGVRYVFGIPGGPSLPYIDEFRKQGIEFILTSHEAAAGIMADVTGRLNRYTWCMPCHLRSRCHKPQHRCRRGNA
ncbi:MAG: thiamine pyrophosphate-binding protein [Bacteroidales bacterium]|nr:thiamine pyrophosphate-binding protein [Bacteroidales bacterium]